MRLLPIVFDLLYESSIIELPEKEIRSVIDKKLVPFIRGRVIPNMRDDITISYNNPYIPEEMNNIFTIPGYNDKIHRISVGFYYDKGDGADARMNVKDGIIVINMASANIADLGTIIMHELTHGIDPKLLNPDIKDQIGQRYGTPHSDYVKMDDLYGDDDKKKGVAKKIWQRYLSDPREFDAHSGEIIRTLSTNFNNLPYEHKYRDKYRKVIWKIILDAGNKTSNELWNIYYYEPVRYMFTDNWPEQQDNEPIINGNFYRWLSIFTFWALKPTMYKRFYSRLAKYIPYSY